MFQGLGFGGSGDRASGFRARGSSDAELMGAQKQGVGSVRVVLAGSREAAGRGRANRFP